MAFNKQIQSYLLVLILTVSFVFGSAIDTTNVDCKGKAFHCVNSTHFKICVDFGGVSKTVDDFLIPCPPSTVCTDNNYFECEYQFPVTSAEPINSDAPTEVTPTTQSYDWELFSVSTFIPVNSNDSKIELADNSTMHTAEILAEAVGLETANILNYTPVIDLNENVSDSVNILQNKTSGGLNVSGNNNVTSKELILNDNLSRTTTTTTEVNTGYDLSTNIFAEAATTESYPATESEILIDLFNTIRTTPSNTAIDTDLLSTKSTKLPDYLSTNNSHTLGNTTRNSSNDMTISVGLNEPVKTTLVVNEPYKELTSTTLHSPTTGTDNSSVVFILPTNVTTENYSGNERLIETSTNYISTENYFSTSLFSSKKYDDIRTNDSGNVADKSNLVSENETWVELNNANTTTMNTMGNVESSPISALSFPMEHKNNNNNSKNSSSDTINNNLSLDFDSAKIEHDTANHHSTVNSLTTVVTIANISEELSHSTLEDSFIHKNGTYINGFDSITTPLENLKTTLKEIVSTRAVNEDVTNTAERTTEQYAFLSPDIIASTLDENSTAESSSHILDFVTTTPNTQYDTTVNNFETTQANDVVSSNYNENIDSIVDFTPTTTHFPIIIDTYPNNEIIIQNQSSSNDLITTTKDNKTFKATNVIDVSSSDNFSISTEAENTNNVPKDTIAIIINATDHFINAIESNDTNKVLNVTKVIDAHLNENLSTSVITDNTHNAFSDTIKANVSINNFVNLIKANNTNEVLKDTRVTDVNTTDYLPVTMKADNTNSTLKDLNMIDLYATEKTTGTVEADTNNTININRNINTPDNLTAVIETNNITKALKDNIAIDVNNIHKFMRAIIVNNTNKAYEDKKSTDANSTDYLYTIAKAVSSNNTPKDTNGKNENDTDTLIVISEAPNNTLKDIKSINVNVADNLNAVTDAYIRNNALKDTITIDLQAIDITNIKDNITSKTIKDITKTTNANSTDNLLISIKANNTNNELKNTNTVDVNEADELTSATKSDSTNDTIKDTNTIDFNPNSISATKEENTTNLLLNNSKVTNVNSIDNLTTVIKANNTNKPLTNTKMTDASSDNQYAATNIDYYNNGLHNTYMMDFNGTVDLSYVAATEADNSINILQDSTSIDVNFINSLITATKTDNTKNALNVMKVPDRNFVDSSSAVTVSENTTCGIRDPNIDMISTDNLTTQTNNTHNALKNKKSIYVNDTKISNSAIEAGNYNNALNDLNMKDFYITIAYDYRQKKGKTNITFKDLKATHLNATDNLITPTKAYELDDTKAININKTVKISKSAITLQDTKSIDLSTTINNITRLATNQSNSLNDTNLKDFTKKLLTKAIFNNGTNTTELESYPNTEINTFYSKKDSEIPNTVIYNNETAENIINLTENSVSESIIESPILASEYLEKPLNLSGVGKAFSNFVTDTNNSNNDVKKINLNITTQNLYTNKNSTYILNKDEMAVITENHLNIPNNIKQPTNNTINKNRQFTRTIQNKSSSTLKPDTLPNKNILHPIINNSSADNNLSNDKGNFTYTNGALEITKINIINKTSNLPYNKGLLTPENYLNVSSYNISLLDIKQSQNITKEVKEFGSLHVQDKNVSYSNQQIKNVRPDHNDPSIISSSTTNKILISENDNINDKRFSISKLNREVNLTNQINSQVKNGDQTLSDNFNNNTKINVLRKADEKEGNKFVSQPPKVIIATNMKNNFHVFTNKQNETLGNANKSSALNKINLNNKFGDILNSSNTNTFNILNKNQVNSLGKVRNSSDDIYINKTENGVLNVNIDNKITIPVPVKREDIKMKKDELNNKNMPRKKEEIKFSCNNRNRGKYSDKNDCQYFYICIGSHYEPIYGKCPNNTVFSEISKQCTKNLSHCIRNNQFLCTSEGRYIDIFSDQFYYICAKKAERYIRFKLKCQKGYSLDKSKLQCLLNPLNGSKSKEDSSKADSAKSTVESKSTDSKEQRKDFECHKEGKFVFKDDCRKYYQCKRSRKSEFRRKIKKCDSGEVFNHEKKKCVNEESYECDD